MRLALLGMLAVLQTCQPDAPEGNPTPQPGESTADTFGKKQDKADSRVAAAVQVARTANADGKPAVVEAELGVAASYLPPAQPGDLAFATLRAQQADPKAYAEAKAYGEKLKAELEDLFTKMETQQKQAAQEIAALKQQLNDRQIALEAARKDKAAAQLGILGAGMLAVGVALLAFGSWIGVSKFNAGLVMLGGIVTASLPWVFDSSYFPWVMGCTLAGAGLQILWALWRKINPKPVPPAAEAEQPPANG
jgi:hypothetical protein